MKQLGVTSADQSAGKRRVVSPRDTRHAFHTPHTGDAHARIDRVHNHNSRATTGSTTRRELRSRKTRADGYEHKVKSRNKKATLAPCCGLGGGGLKVAHIPPALVRVRSGQTRLRIRPLKAALALFAQISS